MNDTILPLYDGHCHTEHSHDSQCPMEELLTAAEAKGLAGVSVTNHCDIQYNLTYDVKAPILAAYEEVQQLRETFDGRVRVFSGVEIGEALYFPDYAHMMEQAADYDVILGSLHAVRFPRTWKPYSSIDFTKFTREESEAYVAAYFRDMQDMLAEFDLDVLSHLDCPLRYITGKFGIPLELARYDEAIEQILGTIIQRGIALEINTSGTDAGLKRPMPSLSYVQRYWDMGGRRLTLGSDCHVSARVGLGFENTVSDLKAMGVRELCYFEHRQIRTYEI